MHAHHPGGHETRFEPDDRLGRLQASLITALAASQRLRPVDVGCLDECRLWRACQLCTYLEYRLQGVPDPRSLTEAAIQDWSRRGLASGERLGDPAELGYYHPYWLMIDGSFVGSLALALWDPGWGETFMWVASLYVFKEWRRRGHGGDVMAELEALAARLDLGGIRLDTHWVWQDAVRLYLRRGFWVANWKRGLSLVRYASDPSYMVRHHECRLDFVLNDPGGLASRPIPLISASREGDRLIWEDHRPVQPLPGLDTGSRGAVEPTFALWLAMAGWPLIRSPEHWAERHHWSDTGMPEGLAYKITVFEAYTRRCGFRVETPRIPGLSYPEWGEL